jgi:hypothetical protein
VALEGEVLEEEDHEVPSDPRVDIIVDTVTAPGTTEGVTMEVGIMGTEGDRVLVFLL